MNDPIEPFLEQFKSLREEIHLRVRQHYQLVTLKILALGATLSFLLGKLEASTPSGPSHPRSFEPLVAWVIPVLAVVFDTMIAGNMRAIRNLGIYIRDHVEPIFNAPAAALGLHWWEQTVASAEPASQCFTTTDLVFIWSFTAASILLVPLTRLGEFHGGDWVGLSIVAPAALIALWLMIQSLTRRDRLLPPRVA